MENHWDNNAFCAVETVGSFILPHPEESRQIMTDTFTPATRYGIVCYFEDVRRKARNVYVQLERGLPGLPRINKLCHVGTSKPRPSQTMQGYGQNDFFTTFGPVIWILDLFGSKFNGVIPRAGANISSGAALP